jgi:hypothetical protein
MTMIEHTNFRHKNNTDPRIFQMLIGRSEERYSDGYSRI